MAFMLVPLGDLFVYYKINDFNSASTSEWSNAATASLVGGVLKLAAVGASFVMKSKALMMVPTISVVQELVSLYLINNADGVVDSSDSSIYYGVTAFNFIVSAANVAMSKQGGKKGGKGDYGDMEGGKPPKGD